MAAMQSRCIPHGEASRGWTDGLVPTAATRAELGALKARVLEQLLRMPPLRTSSLYTGRAGLAYALATVAPADPTARQLFATCDEEEVDVASLLCGGPGVMLAKALSAADEPSARAHAERYVRSVHASLSDAELDNEWLYGRGGLLLGALSLGRRLPAAVPPSLLHTLAQQLLAACEADAAQHAPRLARLPGGAPPLLCAWHGDLYLGAAHGVLGACLALLSYQLERGAGGGALRALACADGAEPEAKLERTLDWALAQRDRAGNLPAHVGGEPTPMVHFCHGAPGACLVYACAHDLFSSCFAPRGGGGGSDGSSGGAAYDGRFRAAALGFAELTYEHGLLKKGPGLCHGVSGNGYVLLRAARLSGDPLWVCRAVQFGRALLDERVAAQSRTPDHPASLFEGLGGALLFLHSLETLTPAVAAAFPFVEPPPRPS